MELTVWVDGIQKVVSGVTSSTTGQEVVLALAQASGRSGCFSLVQSWRDWERPLPPSESPVQSLVRWGEYAGQVRFSLVQKATLEGGRRHYDPFMKHPHKEAVPPSLTPVRSQNEVGKASRPNSLRKSLTFSGAHNSVPFSPMVNVEGPLTPSLFSNTATQHTFKESPSASRKLSPVPKVTDSELKNSKPKSPVNINANVSVGKIIERTRLTPLASKIPLTKTRDFGNTGQSNTSLTLQGEKIRNKYPRNSQQMPSSHTLATEIKPQSPASTAYHNGQLPVSHIQRYIQTSTIHNQGHQQTPTSCIQQQEQTPNTQIQQQQHTPTTYIQRQQLTPTTNIQHQQTPTTHTQRNLQTQIPKPLHQTCTIDGQRHKDEQLTPSGQLPQALHAATLYNQPQPKTRNPYDQPQPQTKSTYDHPQSQIKKIHSQSQSRTYTLKPKNGTSVINNLPYNQSSTKHPPRTRHQMTAKQTSGVQSSRLPMMSNMTQAKSIGKYEQINITAPLTNWQDLFGNNLTSFRTDNPSHNQSPHSISVPGPSSHRSVLSSKYATLNRSIKQTTKVDSVGHCRSLSADNNDINTGPITSYLDELYKKAYPRTHQIDEQNESPLYFKPQGSLTTTLASTSSSAEPRQSTVLSAGSGMSTLKASKERLISSLLPTLVKGSARQEHDTRLLSQSGTKSADGGKEQSKYPPAVINLKPSSGNREQSTNSPIANVHLRNSRPRVATVLPSTQRYSAIIHLPSKFSVPPRPRSVIYNVNSLDNSEIIRRSESEHFRNGSVDEYSRSYTKEIDSSKEDINTYLPIMPKVEYYNEFCKHAYLEANSDLRDQRSDVTKNKFRQDENLGQGERYARTDQENQQKKAGDDFANTRDQQDAGSHMEKLPVKKISLQDRDRQLANYLKQEQTIKNEIEILESTDWETVIQQENNKGRELQLLIISLKEELENTEVRIQELQIEESMKSMVIAAEEDRIDRENQKNRELEEQVLADVNRLQEDLTGLSKSQAEHEEKLKQADHEVETLEAAWSHKVKIIQIMEDALNMDPHFLNVLASVPDSAIHSGEVVLKILECRSSPEYLRSSPVKDLSQKSRTTTRTAMVVIEPNGVWV